MQKFIRVTAIIAAVLVALSFLLLLISIPMQRIIAANWLQYPDDMVSVMPLFPLSQFVHCFLLLGCTALMIVCAGNKRGGIWLEIILLIALLVFVPFLNGVLSNVQNILMGQTRGDIYVAANSIVSRIAAFCMLPGNLGNSLALVACGMSMAFKNMNKKLAQVTAQQ